MAIGASTTNSCPHSQLPRCITLTREPLTTHMWREFSQDKVEGLQSMVSELVSGHPWNCCQCWLRYSSAISALPYPSPFSAPEKSHPSYRQSPPLPSPPSPPLPSLPVTLRSSPHSPHSFFSSIHPLPSPSPPPLSPLFFPSHILSPIPIHSSFLPSHPHPHPLPLWSEDESDGEGQRAQSILRSGNGSHWREGGEGRGGEGREERNKHCKGRLGQRD
jgi:hypothetical protein